MSKLRRNGRRVALVTTLSFLAALGGVWAQQGTDVTLTKFEREHVDAFGSETETDGTSALAWGQGDETTTQQPPAPETTSSLVGGQARSSSTNQLCEVWGGGPGNVNVGPGATTGSAHAAGVPGFITAWDATSPDPSSGPATVSINVTASSDNQGPPNEATSNWYSPDRTIKVTTHDMQFQNPVTGGNIRVSGTGTATSGIVGKSLSCGVDVNAQSGFLLYSRSETHTQVDQ